MTSEVECDADVAELLDDSEHDKLSHGYLIDIEIMHFLHRESIP